MLVGQIKGGTALHPVTQAGILFPFVRGIRECSVTSLCSLSSLPDRSLCFHTSRYLVMPSWQMPLSLLCFLLPASLWFDSERDQFNVLYFTAIWMLKVITHECVSCLFLVHDHFYLWNYEQHEKHSLRPLMRGLNKVWRFALTVPSPHELGCFPPAAMGPQEAPVTFGLSSAITILTEVSSWSK